MHTQFQIAIQLPTVGSYVAFGISGLGIVLLLVGAIATLTRQWNTYENLDDEVTETLNDSNSSG